METVPMPFVQFAIVGVIVWGLVLLLRELRPFFARKGATVADHRVELSVAAILEPIMVQQTSILNELRVIGTRQIEMLLKLQFGVEEMAKTNEALRGHFHVLHNELNVLIGRSGKPQ